MHFVDKKERISRKLIHKLRKKIIFFGKFATQSIFHIFLQAFGCFIFWKQNKTKQKVEEAKKNKKKICSRKNLIM